MNHTKLATLLLLLAATATHAGDTVPYPIVDTAQIRCYDNTTETSFPKKGAAFFGQDAHYESNAPSYKNNDDGTISDVVTGLMWQRSPGAKQTLSEALAGAKACKTGGHRDWRVPTIKELYSLIIFSGTDPDPQSRDTSNLRPFIDTDYFTFQYGDEKKGERIIDSQYGSSTRYVSTTMRSDATLFGVNFADGRIKGYGLKSPRTGKENTFCFIYVRGNTRYGKNEFKDNGNGTITDHATGLTWMQVDSGALKAGSKKNGTMNWSDALKWSENLKYAGHSDWRLPNVKELQSIVDYTRSPKTTNSAAINPLFHPTAIVDEGKKTNYPFYWTGSSHISVRRGDTADYIAFGEALGWMKDRRTGEYRLLDVHGAGSQRSDPKSGDASRYPHGRGPQGDVLRINNYVLCVRGGSPVVKTSGPAIEMKTTAPGGRGSATSRFTGRLDKNGDGKVSRDEFDGPKDRFSRFDKNGDGFITSDEAPTGPPRNRR